MNEAEIQARILLKIGALPRTRLFRNTVGEGWQGKIISKTRESVTLAHPRYVTFGLCVGSSDLIGWHGGRFLAVEVKDAAGKARADQERFINAVLTAGGIAGVARSPDDALLLLD
jgi:hypothetical protein